MAQLFKAGETKIRPGVYYRFSGQTQANAGAMDGINAIVIQAPWGPVGVVTAHTKASSIIETYGAGDGVDCALQLLKAGASQVYIFRPEGSGGAKGTIKVGSATVTAKYPGERNIVVKIQAKPGDATAKECIVLDGTTQLEKFEFAVGGSEYAALKAVLANSKYVDITFDTDGTVTAGEYTLAGGKNPTTSTEDYLKGFQGLEPYRYNVLSTDSADTAVAQVMSAYADEAELTGKLFIGVVGAPTTTGFDDRITAAKAFNNKKIVYFGSGYTTADGETLNGAKAINYVAGVIAATPSNQSIVHSVVNGATDVTEKLTNAQYERAITNGLLLLSIGPDGQVWFDSGVNTLTEPAANEDDGWKKIKRTKVRFELFDRIDRVVAPLIGKINCDTDGIAAVIQAGMGVITSMIAENKIRAGATMVEDPENPRTTDSAWFVIQVDDLDSLEKIYLHYQFRYSQNA